MVFFYLSSFVVRADIADSRSCRRDLGSGRACDNWSVSGKELKLFAFRVLWMLQLHWFLEASFLEVFGVIDVLCANFICLFWFRFVLLCLSDSIDPIYLLFDLLKSLLYSIRYWWLPFRFSLSICIIGRLFRCGLFFNLHLFLFIRLFVVINALSIAPKLLILNVLLHECSHFEKIKLIGALCKANMDQAFCSQELIKCRLPWATRLLHLSHHIWNDQVLQDGELLCLTDITAFKSLCWWPHLKVLAYRFI